MTIQQIQHLLAYLCYYDGLVDGIWGDGSKAACKAFQENYNKVSGKPPILVDGIPGGQTQEALATAVYRGWFKPKPQPKPGDKPMDDADALFWAGIKHFTPSEFTCPCCGLGNMDKRMIKICDDLRERAGVPFIISSGPRCPKHNAEVGGVYNSRHLAGPDLPGRAVDFRLKGMNAGKTLRLVNADGRLAYCYGIDGQYVHMDII